MALRAADPTRALEFFESVLREQPDRVVSLRAAGRLLVKSRRLEQARPVWEKLAAVSPHDPEPHTQLARIHRRAGRTADAAAESVLAAACASSTIAPPSRLSTRPGVWGRLQAALRGFAQRTNGSISRSAGNRHSDLERLPGTTLTARAEAAAGRRDAAAWLSSLEELLAAEGPTARLLALIARDRDLVPPSPPAWLRAVDALTGLGPGSREAPTPMPAEAMSDALGGTWLRRAIKRRAAAGDAGGVTAMLEELVGVEGPTEQIREMIRLHRGLLLPSNARLLNLVDAPAPTRAQPGEALADKIGRTLRDGQIELATDRLEALSRLEFSDGYVREALARAAAPTLACLQTQRSLLSSDTLGEIEARLARIYAEDAWVIQTLAAQQEAGGSPEAALQLFEHLADSAPDAAPTLLQATALACRLSDWEAASRFAKRALEAAPRNRNLLVGLTTLFSSHDRGDEVIACWRRADERDPHRIWVKVGLLRALDAGGQTVLFSVETLDLLNWCGPFIALAPQDQNYLIDVVRRLAQARLRAGLAVDLAPLEALLKTKEPPSALREWMLASFALARPDYAAALAHLDEGLVADEPANGVALDLHAEKALVYQRYHLFGAALAQIALASPAVINMSSHYERRFEIVHEVARLCQDNDGTLLYPECLFDVLMHEIKTRPMRYDFRPRHVTMVAGSLGQGGGERQTITVVRRVLDDPRVEKLALMVRSTHMRPTDDFFLSAISELPIDLTVYGKDWEARSDIVQALPEFADRPRIVAAVDLLPHNAREEMVRLCRHLLDARPQAVHIWQDIPIAAMACALVGTPNFFVHRGSLAPDFWQQTEHQTAVHFRPMRHAYRRLLERPDFVLLNNSISGCETDQNWLQWPEPAPFRVVYNAVDFAQLGEHTGRNLALRRELGIPDDAPVVGGSFRIMAVKRPRYWIAAAHRVRQAIPNAHFLIIGDGDMTDEVAAYAASHGFADAVHLPGRVSNVGDWYRAMDLKLMTSEREGIPNAIIEAQHFGVPIVATDVGGIPEAIDPGETGFVAPGGQGFEPYADRIIALLNDPEWMAAASRKAPAFVHRKFSLDTVLDQLMGYYGVSTD